jgi:hypothetical protein
MFLGESGVDLLEYGANFTYVAKKEKTYENK